MNKRINWLISLGIFAVNPMASAAVFDVSNVSELRAALNAAANNNEDNIINLAAGTYFTTDDSGGSFLYNSPTGFNLTIQDEDLSTLNDVILDGDTIDEVLVIKSETGGASFSINGLTLQHGKRGARVEKGNLTIDNSRFVENINTSSIDDGAGLLFNQNAYDLTIQNTQFTSNSVSNSRHGGAAYLSVKNLSITDSVFDQNSAGRYGGALYIYSIYGNNNAQIDSSEFTNNSAETGGAVFSSSNKLSILDSEFQQNSASNQGGAVFGFLQLVNRSRFIGNSSAYNSAALSGAAEIVNSIFKGNSATNPNTGYGATTECQNCRILNNVFDNNSVKTEILIKSGYQSDSNVIANNIFLNTETKLLASTSTIMKATLKNNFFDPSMIGLPAEQVFQTDNIFSATPGLDENYNTSAGSDLIDSGYANDALFSLPNTDILGNSRVAGSSVDIGPMEYGSSMTLPQINSFSILSGSPKNLQDLTFSISYTLYGERTLGTVSFDDGSGAFSLIELDQNNQFLHKFIEPGNKNLRLKVQDSLGEESVSSINLLLSAQTISEVINLTKDECQASPNDCNIDANSYYDSGYAAAINECALNPSACGISTEDYLNQGKNICIQDPSACNIRADFDYTQLPSTSSAGWKLLGTSEPILNMNQFADVKIVWAQKNGSWYAYSSDTAISSALSQKGIPTLTSIGAYSGFWVTK